MASFDITSFIQNNVSTLAPIAQAVAGTVVGAMLLRKKTGVETGTIEFEKIKAGKFSEAVDILLESGKITYTEFFKMKNYSDIARKVSIPWLQGSSAYFGIYTLGRYISFASNN